MLIHFVLQIFKASLFKERPRCARQTEIIALPRLIRLSQHKRNLIISHLNFDSRPQPKHCSHTSFYPN